MYTLIIEAFQTFNQLLTAGIAITAFSLVLYALSFNLRDRVARSFTFILIAVAIVFVGDTLASSTTASQEIDFWLRFEWVGIVILPSAYLHFSDALLATTGRPSRGRRRLLIRITYLFALAFLTALFFQQLVGPLVEDVYPAPHLERTWLTWVFTFFYAAGMIWAWINFYRALKRTATSASRRRMQYLLAGALAPALGSYPYLLFGSGIAAHFPLLFWLAVTVNNLFVSILLVVMAYAVAFFGVPWPDRVVKRRLFKWLMRGPVTASIVLSLTTIVRRTGVFFGTSYSAAVPVTMVASLLVLEHLITLASPYWERWLFHGGDKAKMQLLQTLEERLITSGDLRQFLESILAAVCDRLQTTRAFAVVFGLQGIEMVVTVGGGLLEEEMPDEFIKQVIDNGLERELYAWANYWLMPLFEEREGKQNLLGLLGIVRTEMKDLDEEQVDTLFLLAHRAELALEDRSLQQQVFTSLENLSPQMDWLQRLRAASRYDGSNVLTASYEQLETRKLSHWVKDALSHYWGGPKLTESPLLRLKVVQKALEAHDGNTANAVREILNEAINQTRPEGERRFTAEWILYNILEMKFLEGHKVRDIASRLAMSEADLYRKQRVAIEAVANAIVEMEQEARREEEMQGEKLLEISSSPNNAINP